MTKGSNNTFDKEQSGGGSWNGWWGHKDWTKPSNPAPTPPAPTQPTTKLTVTFNSEEAGYASAMGWYNARTGEAGILFTDLNDDGKWAGVKAGDSRSLNALQSDVDAGNIGFFLVPDGANQYSKETLNSQMRFEVGSNGVGRIVIDRPNGWDKVLSGEQGDVLFSNQVYNRGGYDYVSGTVGTDGQTRTQKLGTQSDGTDGILGTMAWDDQMVRGNGNCGPDRDFNDLVFTVSKDGGSNPPPPPPPPPVNHAPTDIALSNASVSENAAGAVIGMLSTTDPDAGNTFKYSVSDSRFEVVDGALKLKSGVSLDYEAASSVALKVTTTDQGGLSYSENFTITVKDVNEAPANHAPTDIALSNASVSENAAGAVIGMLSTTDPDAGNTFKYSVNDDRFEVVDGALKLKNGVSLDYEAASTVPLKITTTDQGGLSYSESFTITVKDVNEAPTNHAPTDIALSNASVNENAAGAVVGNLTTTDPDAGNTFTYSVDDTRFEVVNGQLKLKSTSSLDFEAGSSVALKITTTDQGGLSYSENFTITVKDVNEAPTDIALSNLTVDENKAGAVVGTLSATDPDAGSSFTYSVNDNRFEVVNGQLKLKSNSSLDFEAAGSVPLKVTVTDQGGLTYSESFTIGVNNVNEAPTDIALSSATINENVVGGTIGTLTTTDPDAGNTFTYSVNDSRFEVVNDALKLKSGVSLDYELGNTVPIKITTTDQGGLSYTESFTITVKDVNDAPTSISITNLAVDENDAGALIGKLSTTDQDAGDTFTYKVDDTRFEVVGDKLQLKSGVSLDHETDATVKINVTSTDAGGKSFTRAFTVSVTDENEAPSTPVDANSSANFVLETATVGTVVGLTASSKDQDAGDAVKYSLSNNAGGLFAIDPTTGVVTVAGTLNYDVATQHTITVRATDKSNAYSESDFTIKVGDVATQVVVDGYMADATVFADANGNGVRDSGEAFTSTDAFGGFSLNSGTAPLVMVGGLDIATDLQFRGRLVADAGSTVVTPLTTLLHELNVLGTPNAAGQLANALGLAAGTNFGQLDPIATASTSITPFARSSQVLNTVTMVAGLMTGAYPTLSFEQTTAAAFAALASLAADGVLDLTDTATLQQLINGTATRLGVAALDAGLVADAATVIDASNTAINSIVAGGGTTATLLSNISAASIVAQGDATAAFNFAGATGDTESLVEDFTNGGLTSQINAAVSQVGNVNGTMTQGTAGNDTLSLPDTNDNYNALGGDDTIDGKGGRDTLLGGDGNDTLTGGDGNDRLYGGVGVDVLNGGNDEDRLAGGAGNDTLNGGLGADTYLHSGLAADGDDMVNAGDDGVDHVQFTTADLGTLAFRRSGNDLLIGAHHTGGPEFDGSIRVVNHYAGASIAFAAIDTGNNLAYGADPDLARFFFTTDLANGLDNTDAAEVLLGDSGNNTINGNGGYYDAIYGGAGNDIINGGDDGVDDLHGDAGNDQIFAGAGNDILEGGAGSDTLNGGADADTFVFDLATSGADTLVGFEKANDILSFVNVADKDSNGLNLADVQALVTGIQTMNGNTIVSFSGGASLTFQGVTGISTLGDLVANTGTQIKVA